MDHQRERSGRNGSDDGRLRGKQWYGFVPNIRKAMGLYPAALEAYAQLSGAVYHSSMLAPEDREMIATAVSALNRCHY